FLVLVLIVLGVFILFGFFVLLRGCRVFAAGDIIVEGLPDFLQILVIGIPLVLPARTESLDALQLGSSETKATDNLADLVGLKLRILSLEILHRNGLCSLGLRRLSALRLFGHLRLLLLNF